MKTLKLFNGQDWSCRGGHLYVAAYSVKDACDITNEAYRKLKGYTDRPDIKGTTLSEIKTYWSKGCWGNPMAGITPERGVWWVKKQYGGPSGSNVPERIF